MNKLTDCIKLTLRNFAIVTVVIMVVSASYITFFYGPHAVVEVTLFWQILFVSFMCSLNHLFFMSRKMELSKRQFWYRWGICYTYVNIVVLGFGIYFRWFEPSSLPMLIGMIIAITVAFVFCVAIVFVVDLKISDEINQKLRERNGDS